MLERLRMDPGTRTLGELLQERQWAAWEIERLREAWQSRIDVPRGLRSSLADDPIEANPNRLLRIQEVQKLLSVSRPTIYNAMNRGDLPKPVKVTGTAVRWRLGDLVSWMLRNR
jgi:prophage regulatory protein